MSVIGSAVAQRNIFHCARSLWLSIVITATVAHFHRDIRKPSCGYLLSNPFNIITAYVHYDCVWWCSLETCCRSATKPATRVTRTPSDEHTKCQIAKQQSICYFDSNKNILNFSAHRPVLPRNETIHERMCFYVNQTRQFRVQTTHREFCSHSTISIHISTFAFLFSRIVR